MVCRAVIFLVIVLSVFGRAEAACDPFYVGELLNQSGFEAAAAECYAVSEVSTASIRLAQMLLNQGLFADAEQLLDNAWRERQDDPWLLFWLSRTRSWANDHVGALEAANLFAEAVGDTLDSRMLFARLALTENDTQQAIDILTEAIQLYPSSWEPRLLLYQIAQDTVDLSELEWRLQDQPGDHPTRDLYAGLLVQANRQGAGSLQRRVAQGGLSRLQKARDFVSRGLWQEAEEQLTSYLHEAPGDTDAVYVLGSVLLAQGRLDALCSLLASFPVFPEALLLQAGKARAQNRQSDAVALYWEYLRGNPRAPDGYVGVGYTYLAMGRYDLAARDFRSALYLAPQYRDAYVGICRAYTHQERWGDVLYWSNLGLDRFPNAFELRFRRAVAFMELGDSQAAIRALRSSIPSGDVLEHPAFLVLAAANVLEGDLHTGVLMFKQMEPLLRVDHAAYPSLQRVLWFGYEQLELPTHAALAKETLMLLKVDVSRMDKTSFVDEVSHLWRSYSTGL